MSDDFQETGVEMDPYFAVEGGTVYFGFKLGEEIQACEFTPADARALARGIYKRLLACAYYAERREFSEHTELTRLMEVTVPTGKPGRVS